jgi:two-component system nitrate/nitrite response regulator NarL
MSSTHLLGHGAPNVVVAENDPATFAGIRMALEAGGISVSEPVQSLAELIDAVERLQPDACLVDVDLDGDGILAAAQVAARAPHVAVVLLADDDTEDRFLDAMRAGAAGFVSKRIPSARLPKVIRAVLDGEPAIPRALVSLLIDSFRERTPRRQFAAGLGRGIELTAREWEVLEFLRDGLTTREIAGRLLIAEVTVRRHIGSVLKKLQVSSRADALRLLETA